MNMAMEESPGKKVIGQKEGDDGENNPRPGELAGHS